MSMVWREVNEAVLKSIEQINFEGIANRQRSQVKTITYEI